MCFTWEFTNTLAGFETRHWGSDSNCFQVEDTLKPSEHGGQEGVNFLHLLKTKGTRPPRISLHEAISLEPR
jgi:hypothetical protein